jgi:hypothetical protein
MISLPLCFYFIGKLPDIFELPTEPWLRIVYRIGSIGGSILFGVAFFMVAHKVKAIRDYLVVSAIGIILIGISLSTSNLQQTFGIAAHSLVLLASYLFSVGLFSSAISISHDMKLRHSIRHFAGEQSDLLDSIGVAQMHQEIKSAVTKIAKDNSEVLVEQSGVQPSLAGQDMKEYIEAVIKEIRKDDVASPTSAAS